MTFRGSSCELTVSFRIVVQATPPFLVVHANAAFTGLTGVDSHSIIGKPIQTILSVPEQKDSHSHFVLTEINNADGSHSGQSSMTNSASANRGQLPAQEHAHVASPQQTMQEQHLPQQQHFQEMSNILNHAAAAAAGEARANETKEMNIERLVAASGFGQVHVLNVSAKPHRMLGRNVTVFRETYGDAFEAKRAGDDQDISLPSNEGRYHFVTCSTGISPVVSSPNAIDHTTVVTDQEGANKRRKYHHHHSSYRRHGKNNLVTHYVIQLEKVQTGSKQQSRESQSSASRSNLLSRKSADEHAESGRPPTDGEDGDEGSVSTDPKEAVSAIG